jgi:hypothetical protein
LQWMESYRKLVSVLISPDLTAALWEVYALCQYASLSCSKLRRYLFCSGGTSNCQFHKKWVCTLVYLVPCSDWCTCIKLCAETLMCCKHKNGASLPITNAHKTQYMCWNIKMAS